RPEFALNGFTYHAGSTGAITEYADGTGKVLVTDEGHGLVTGDIISIRGTTNYNGIWVITKVNANSFTIPDTWVADDGASDWDQGSYLLAGDSVNGVYTMAFTISMLESGAAGSDLHIQTYVNGNACPKCEAHLTTGNNKLSSLAGHSINALVAGDRFSITVESSGVNTVTVAHGNLSVHQL
ncbi:unnamed protein product, partial [marine sediment metagenome]